ncbi:Proline-rich receptor-like protein kinase PERK8 [Gossypium arboreum]|uniref:non-specific serine/threonine protein kinase n=1 Tax=Gossypium arboreum TaxID=29729 RepID=A0A0B0N0H3_GOSAR|nr:Proline-rich receptor-like protein kinase PERK8 [Gossypium arboreum]
MGIQMSRNLAAILGGAAGAVALVGIVGLLIWFCLFHKRGVSRTSETGSSDPSVQGRHIGVQLSLREARRFELRELSLATKNFSDRNLIGEGKFGEVYKGLLQDGMLVAIKKRAGAPSQEFIDEHRNLVTLLGYCQENNQQFLVYEYIPNGSVSIHLYGVGQVSAQKIEFKHRLSIALGAAKGLAHLHSLSPRLVHKDFKTANVLVDENFIAKVADAGLRNFLGRIDVAGPSSQVTADEIFLAPEVREFRRFSEKSDVYSFGVFLLELVSGREASELPSSNSTENLVEWGFANAMDWRCYELLVQNSHDYSNISSIIDPRLGSSFTAEGMEEFIRLTVRCLEPSSERRPTMSYVVAELDRILDKEMSLTTVMGEGSPTVTLGSQLFRATK